MICNGGGTIGDSGGDGLIYVRDVLLKIIVSYASVSVVDEDMEWRVGESFFCWIA